MAQLQYANELKITDQKSGKMHFRYCTNIGPYHKTHGIQDYINSNWTLAEHVEHAISQVHPTVVAQMPEHGGLNALKFMVYVFPANRKEGVDSGKLDTNYRFPIAVYASTRRDLQVMTDEFDVQDWFITPVASVEHKGEAEAYVRKFYLNVGAVKKEVAASFFDEDDELGDFKPSLSAVIERVKYSRRKPLLATLFPAHEVEDDDL